MKNNYDGAPESGAFPRTLTSREFTKLAIAGRIVDGRAGGLVIGAVLNESCILAVHKRGSGYDVLGALQNGEFLVNWQASRLNWDRLNAINSSHTPNVCPDSDDETIYPLETTQFILAQGNPHARLIFVNFGQFVVSLEAAQRHLWELQKINSKPNPYTQCDLCEIFGMPMDSTPRGLS